MKHKTKTINYLSFRDMVARFCSEHDREYKSVAERLLNWQGGFGKAEQAVVLLSASTFLHYLDVLGSQWIVDTGLLKDVTRYLREAGAPHRLFVHLDL